VHRTGRRLEPVRAVANPISSNGVAADANQADVLEKAAVEAQSCHSTTSCADQLYLRMQFLTAKAAARRMAKAGLGELSR
jgi:hypothetical protein